MGMMRVACVQMRSGTNEAANIAAMEKLVREAAGEGAVYVQTPEMTGIMERDPANLLSQISEDEGNPVFAAAASLARELGIWLHLGSTAIKLGERKAANRGALFSPRGQRVATYDKIHMFDVDLDGGESYRESNRYEPGGQSVVVDTGAFKLGMAVCYDVRFPRIFRKQAQCGAQILTLPAAFTRPTGKAHWKTLLTARAIENGAFVIAAAQGGEHEDGRATWGHSIIIGPWGEIVGELEHDEPGILVRDIDLQEAGDARAKIPALANERDFTISEIGTAV
ncbi:MAG: carbon-nitrogen hydrolase family protein [Nitratireductor sp.]|nr:carbon-nitrogen hydrolase family protein [Nitratireductor sp.]